MLTPMGITLFNVTQYCATLNMALSNRHPYYVNYLCDILWEICPKRPELIDIDNAWKSVIIEEWSDALNELSDLPMGQRRLLKYIANNHVKNIQSQETCTTLSMPANSLSTAIHVLLEKDYVDSIPQFLILDFLR